MSAVEIQDYSGKHVTVGGLCFRVEPGIAPNIFVSGGFLTHAIEVAQLEDTLKVLLAVADDFRQNPQEP